MSKLRVALVTGGTRGIGAAIAEGLKQRGYHVAVTYQGNHQAAAAFQDKTGISTYCWDVSNFDACIKGVAQVATDYGPVAVLVNNAGITQDCFLHKMSLDKWQSVISANLNSCFNMSRAVIEEMRQRLFGRIINVSSINGQKGQIGQTNYCASKAGMIGFTKALALESATKGITVNAVAPGYIETDMVREVAPEILEKIKAQIPSGRLGTADEVARAVTFLADESSGFINGTILSINGAQYLIG